MQSVFNSPEPVLLCFLMPSYNQIKNVRLSLNVILTTIWVHESQISFQMSPHHPHLLPPPKYHPPANPAWLLCGKNSGSSNTRPSSRASYMLFCSVSTIPLWGGVINLNCQMEKRLEEFSNLPEIIRAGVGSCELPPCFCLCNTWLSFPSFYVIHA